MDARIGLQLRITQTPVLKLGYLQCRRLIDHLSERQPSPAVLESIASNHAALLAWPLLDILAGCCDAGLQSSAVQLCQLLASAASFVADMLVERYCTAHLILQAMQTHQLRYFLNLSIQAVSSACWRRNHGRNPARRSCICTSRNAAFLPFSVVLSSLVFQHPVRANLTATVAHWQAERR
jgi:hypothetical protein